MIDWSCLYLIPRRRLPESPVGLQSLFVYLVSLSLSRLSLLLSLSVSLSVCLSVCLTECMQGFYGDSCNQTCACANGGSCDPVHGRCTCRPGFHSDLSQQGAPLQNTLHSAFVSTSLWISFSSFSFQVHFFVFYFIVVLLLYFTLSHILFLYPPLLFN